ncbi:hypothetical protein GQ53DRAFT_820477 [Thozetella sp. PMI_491]|nr:hypothetical protein GQ53DRAFT_820477 [Thozetella sp. PMI_491]
MMETATLQTPKTRGRSRFSKALPAPPPSFLPEIDTSSLSKSPLLQPFGLPSTPRKPLPQAPSPMNRLSDLPPPIPPPKEATPKSPGFGVDLALPVRKEVPRLGASSGLPRSPLDSNRKMMGTAASLPKSPLDIRPWPPVETPVRATGTASFKSPIESPAPPAEKLNGSSQMSIPRRPVAPALPSPPSQKSPVESLSSLLSAYTDHSDDSARKSTNSTTDSTSTRASHLDASPTRPPKGSSAFAPSRVDSTSSSSSLLGLYGANISANAPSQSEPLPPLRTTSNEAAPYRPHTPPSQTPQTRTAGSTISPDSPTLSSFPNPVNTASSPSSSPRQPQIWQRRSVKTEKTLGISELKLTSSHGSTAATATVPSVEPVAESLSNKSLLPPPQNSLTTTPVTSSRSPLTGNKSPLPGRNIRPAAPRPPQPAEEKEPTVGRESNQFMNGTKTGEDSIGFLSKVESLKAKLAEQGEKKEEGGPTTKPTSKPTSPQEQIEIKKIVSSAAAVPAVRPSSPEEQRLKLAISLSVAAPATRAAPPPAVVEPAAAPSSHLRPARSPSNPAKSPIASPLGGLPASPAPNRIQPPQPQPQLQSQPQQQELQSQTKIQPQQAAFPPRASSRTKKPQDTAPQSGLGIIAESRPSQEASEVMAFAKEPVPAEARPMSFDEVEEAQEELTDHPGAALFPRDWYTPVENAEAPVPARPITTVQRSGCYTGHRSMGRRHPEGTCEVACQACGAGTLRYRVCAFCTLLLCEDCNWALGQHGGNLQAMMEATAEVAVA